MNFVVTGATGFVGTALCSELRKARHTVCVLSRDPARARARLGEGVRSVGWTQDADSWKDDVSGADIIVNLAGESVGGKRWTPEFKATLRSSRIDTTRLLVRAMRERGDRPQTLINASAVGYYGDRKEEELTESSPPGSGFLAELCAAWEAEALAASAFGARVACMRLGIVLGAGGALDRMLYPLPLHFSPWKLGLGGPMGRGDQWMPWVHLRDTVGMLQWAAIDPRVSGPVNVTAPDPVRNREMAHALGRALKRPERVPVPAFVLRAMLGEFADSILGGQRALPSLAHALGYEFQFETIDAALAELLAG